MDTPLRNIDHMMWDVNAPNSLVTITGMMTFSRPVNKKKLTEIHRAQNTIFTSQEKPGTFICIRQPTLNFIFCVQAARVIPTTFVPFVSTELKVEDA